MTRLRSAAAALAVFALCSRPLLAADCDRECLRGFITQYLNAMVAHTPGALPLAANVRFTEDTVDMKLGEGLWKQASKLRPYRLDILDVTQGVAASQVVVEEAGSPVMLMLRLKVVDRKIAEVETQVTRSQKEGAIFAVDALQSPNAAMLRPVEPARAQLTRRGDPAGGVLPRRPRDRQLRHGERAVCRRRVSLRERAADGRQGLHVPPAVLRRHQGSGRSRSTRASATASSPWTKNSASRCSG